MVIVTKVSLLLIFPPTKSEIIETTLCEDWFHYVSEIEGKTAQDPEKKCNLTTQSHKIQCIFLLEIQGKKALCVEFFGRKALMMLLMMTKFFH